MQLVIFSVLVIGTLGAPASQSLSVNEDGTYQFSYETGNEGGNHFRTESKGPDGAVIGTYSYNDPTGRRTVVNYRADDTGFVVGEDGEVPKPSASENHEAPIPEPAAKAEDSEKEKQKEEISSATETADQDSDEEKPLKLEEAINDLPPEGFPPGFFSGQFNALRRLPEPSKEEEEPKNKVDGKTDESATDATPSTEHELKGLFSAGWQPEALPPEAFPPGFFLQQFTGLRRLGEPVKKQGSAQTTDETKPEDAATTTKITGQGFHTSYILPFPSFTPHLWPASSHHNPVYVYSYQQPNAYRYGYSYQQPNAYRYGYSYQQPNAYRYGYSY